MSRLLLSRTRATAPSSWARVTRAVRVLAVALLAVGLSLTGVSAASADPSLPVTGISVNQNDGTVRSAIQISRLYPGSQQQAVLLLDGSQPELARRMEIGVASLADLENECIHPETGTGDTTCSDGADQGELSRFLDVTLTAGLEGSANDHRTCQPVGAPTTTTLIGLAHTPVIVGLPTDDGTLCVIATFAHRNTPGDNVTQTDVVRFDLRLRFDTLAVPTPTGSPTSTGTPTSTPSPTSSGPSSPTPSPTSTGTGSPTSGGTQPTVGDGSGGDDGDGTQVEGVKYERPVVVSRVERGRAELGALPRTGTNLPNLLIIAATLLGVGTVMVAVVRGRRRPGEEAA